MAPLSEELIERLFGVWREVIDSEPYAHEANTEDALAAWDRERAA